jgi:Fe-S-cluster-containing dehydrogenase component
LANNDLINPAALRAYRELLHSLQKCKTSSLRVIINAQATIKEQPRTQIFHNEWSFLIRRQAPDGNRYRPVIFPVKHRTCENPPTMDLRPAGATLPKSNGQVLERARSVPRRKVASLERE